MLTQSELDAMAETAEASMMDTCALLVASITYDAVGSAVQVWSESTALPCGVRFTSEREQESIELAGVRYNVAATIRLPLDVLPQVADRLQVTHRYGRVLAAPWLFEVLGAVRTGPTANVVKVRQIL